MEVFLPQMYLRGEYMMNTTYIIPLLILNVLGLCIVVLRLQTLKMFS